ncbi:MAG TPA: hypothetical protein VM577_19440 [Anaerovoracaceae bacterium]|nr:hypothetical protein [Anaerovoracaceae bacterium]
MNDCQDETEKQEDLNVFFGIGGYDANDVQWFVEKLEKIDIHVDGANPDCLENLLISPDGVYCDWCGDHFSSFSQAVDYLKTDRGALEAAFRKEIDIEPQAYIESMFNDYPEKLSKDECEKVVAMEEYFRANSKEFKEMVEKAKLESSIQVSEVTRKKLKL